MRQITVARCFERIGDNAVDIGEQTAFVVTGEFAEFTDASHDVRPLTLEPTSASFTTSPLLVHFPSPHRQRGCGDDRGGSAIRAEGVGTDMRHVLRRRVALLLVGVVAGLAIVSTATGAGPNFNLKKLKGSITADGSSTVGPYTTAAAELFRQAGATGVRVTVRICRHRRRLPTVLQGRRPICPMPRGRCGSARRSPARTTTSAAGVRSRSRTTR